MRIRLCSLLLLAVFLAACATPVSAMELVARAPDAVDKAKTYKISMRTVIKIMGQGKEFKTVARGDGAVDTAKRIGSMTTKTSITGMGPSLDIPDQLIVTEGTTLFMSAQHAQLVH